MFSMGKWVLIFLKAKDKNKSAAASEEETSHSSRT